MKENYFPYTVEDNVAALKMNRPHVNGLDVDFLAQMGNVSDELNKRDDVRVVLWGSNLKVFGAGMDLAMASKMDKNAWNNYMKRTVSSMEEGRNGCSFLGQKGCTLERSERPIMCIFYTCSRQRAQMNAEQKKSHAQLTEALYDVCLETFDVLKQEAGLPKRYGKLRLFLLPL